MFDWMKKSSHNSFVSQGVMNQENKVLILGAGGNLGSQLRQVLANEYRLLLWDREEVDALDFEVLEAKVKEHRPNLIINCVAYNAVDKCEEDEAEFELAKKFPAHGSFDSQHDCVFLKKQPGNEILDTIKEIYIL